jgi:hypothetical protein
MRVGMTCSGYKLNTLKTFLVSIDAPDSLNGALLTDDTEVVIAPRTRTPLREPFEEKQIRGHLSTDNPVQDVEDFLILRVLPPEFFQACISAVFPFQRDNDTDKNTLSNGKYSTSTIAFTSLRSFLKITTSKADCPTWTRDTKLIAPLELRQILPPFEKKTTEELKPPQKEPRLLHRSEAGGENTEPQLSEVLTAFLMPSAIVPDHDLVIIYSSLGAGGYMKSWELVK